MKHFIRDVFVWLVVSIGLAGRLQRQKLKAGPSVRVLAFHDVADAAWFRVLIDTIKKQYHIVTPNEFEQGVFSEEKINILLTFDDGYESWVSNVLPVLNERGLKGIFFVSTGIVETADDAERSAAFMRERLLVSPKSPLTQDGLIALHTAGQTIGGHTHSHVSLGSVSKEEIVTEVSSNRLMLQDVIDAPVTHFAYPFGTSKDFTDATTTYLHESGFTHVYSAISGFFTKDMREIPRTLVEKNQSIGGVCRWIEGGYDIFVGIVRPLR